MNLGSVARKAVGEVFEGRFIRRLQQFGRAALEELPAQWKGPRCVLPDFFIVGAMKSGTSFLFWVLRQHPQVVGSLRKEVNYFNLRYWHSLNWYRAQLPAVKEVQARTRETGLPTLAGEASLYMQYPHAARRIARHLPRAKIIILLRNPVERTISDYHHMVRLGHETLSFEAAIAAEASRLQGEGDNSPAVIHGYTARSVYVHQVAEFYKHFPREQILVLPSETLYADPIAVGGSVQSFLGLQPRPPRAIRRINSGKYTPPHGPVMDYLRSYFKPHNERLYEFLGVDFGWDRPSGAAAA